MNISDIINHFLPNSTMELVGTVFGILCFLIALINFVFTSRDKIIVVKMLSNVVSGANNFFYGKYLPMAICGINMFREFVFYFRGKKRWADSKLWMFAFMLAIVGAPFALQWLFGSAGWKWSDLIPSAASCVIVFALYSTNTVTTKIGMAVGQSMYVAYYCWVGNFSAVSYSAAAVVSSVIGLVREYRKRKTAPAAPGEHAGWTENGTKPGPESTEPDK